MALKKRIQPGRTAAIAAWLLAFASASVGQSLVPNWEFDDALNGWWIGISGDATGTYDLDGSGMLSGPNSLRIQVTEGGTVDWYVMPDATVSMEKGKKYDLSFLAVADQKINVSVLIGESGGAYAVYWQKAFTIADTISRFGPFGTSKRPYTWECTRPDGIFELKFLFGKYDFVTIWLDSVMLKEHVETGVENRQGGMTTDFRLAPNYPNPFNPHTVIRYDLPETCRVRLAVFDAGGAETELLFDGMQSGGGHSVLWNQDPSLASGMYFIRLEAGGHVATRKMTLLR
jgi:hypothetical protein